jgi:hypothetical protein
VERASLPSRVGLAFHHYYDLVGRVGSRKGSKYWNLSDARGYGSSYENVRG